MSIDLNPKLFTQLALDLQVDPLCGFPDHFFILDCETTGGRPVTDRMTELAWIEIKDGRIAGHYQQLFNPELPVPPWITKLTGISTDMVRDEPTFADCAENIYDQLHEQVIVAHNARFDYGFLKNEFRRLEKCFTAKTLCSVKLSRNLFPQLKGHGLDAIIRRFDIQLEYRHRAMSDVLAVLAFFKQVDNDGIDLDLENTCNKLLKKPSLPSQLDPEEVNKLPHTPGVYYMYDNEDSLLYVGKSVDLKTRVMSHFVQDHQSATDAKITQSVQHIHFKETETDFGAQILESIEIKRLCPAYNQRLRRSRELYQLQLEPGKDGYLRPAITPTKMTTSNEDCFGLFKTKLKAKNRLRKLATDHGLCHKVLGIESASKGPCFAYQLHQCQGACVGEEDAESHNNRLLSSLEEHKQVEWPWDGPILVSESDPVTGNGQSSHLIDQWCHYGLVTDEDDIHDRLDSGVTAFDLDLYHILVKFLYDPNRHAGHGLSVFPLNSATLSHVMT